MILMVLKMAFMRLALPLLAMVFLIAPPDSLAQTPAEKAVRISEAAVGNLIPPLSLTSSRGETVKLTELAGKPVLITLIYTGCFDVCPAIISKLAPAIEIAQNALGKDSFTTITVGFDTANDTPERMASFARQRGIDLPNWLFLSGDQDTIDKLATAVGFTFKRSAGGFNHMAQVSVIDGDGRVYQQVLGGQFSPPSIVEPLKNVLFNQRRSILSVGGIADRIKVFCTVYNPKTGRYYFDYSLFIRIGIGAVSLLLIFLFLLREFKLSKPPTEGR